MEIFIKRGGFLKIKEWKFNKKKNSGKYIFINIPKKHQNILGFLNESIILDKNFTVRDWFKLVINYPQLQLLDFFMNSYIKEFKSCSRKKCLHNEIHYIIFKKHFEYNDYDECLEYKITCNHSVYVTGKSNLNDMSYGIEFTPLKHYLDLPIKLMGGISYTDYEKSKKNRKLNIDVNTKFTLFEFIKSFIWEISWFGVPEKRDKFSKDLKKIHKKVIKEKWYEK